ncbi:MAG: hypothetical protein PF590_03325 [Candidatus Delongbacteria bacterium]|jgi:hypothetical protein|nr:hypothetical protein [Candidatus Delongbacteria bacterium]
MVVKKIFIWVTAALVTVAASYYQRQTGPTKPMKMETEISGDVYKFTLTRSASIFDGCIISIPDHEGIDKTVIVYKKYPGDFLPDSVIMQKNNGNLTASLPIQPAAGKLQYYLVMYQDGDVIFNNEDDTAIVRFKGNVPGWALIPHVLFMFLAMFFSTAAMLMAIFNIGNIKNTSILAFGILALGGFVFGPIVQNYAFGQAWTGWPVGYDLTDNKVLIAGTVWLLAILLNLHKKRRWAVIVAGIVLLGMFTIPHSARGSEFDYETQEIKTG